MIFITNKCSALFLTIMVFAGSAAEAQPIADELTGALADESWLWRGPSLNDESIYKQIQGVELVAHSTFLRHPYEIIIPNTAFGTFFFCQLFDVDGAVLTGRYENARSGETNIFFTTMGPVSSAVCVDARDYRKVDKSSPSSENPIENRFLQPPEDNEPSPSALAREPRCDAIGQNVKFCPGDSEWVRETYPISRPGDFYQNLYQLSATQRAAVTAIFMRKGESLDVSDAQLETLAAEHTFENGPRGRMTIETIIEDWPVEPYKPRRRRVTIAMGPNGSRYLLTVDVYRAHYGIALEETTILLPERMQASEVDQTYFSLHHDFDLLTRYSFSAGR